MKKQRKPESFIRQPRYPGGKKAMDEFIRHELRYPEEAMKNRVEGTVSVEIDIDVFGDVMDARVRHSLGYGCDEEAIRLVRLLKFEKKKYQGLRVMFHQTLNIHFRLAAIPPSPAQQQQIVYHYKENPNKAADVSHPYTIPKAD